MKQIVILTLMLIWIIGTIILAVSLIGMIVILDEDTGWIDIPRMLISKL